MRSGQVLKPWLRIVVTKDVIDKRFEPKHRKAAGAMVFTPLRRLRGKYDDRFRCGLASITIAAKLCADKGYFVDKKNATTQTPCALGKYAQVRGSRECVDASAGYYVENTVGATEQKKCPKGRYSNTSGAISCTDCDEGYYADTAGSPACTIAPAGTLRGQRDHVRMQSRADLKTTSVGSRLLRRRDRRSDCPDEIDAQGHDAEVVSRRLDGYYYYNDDVFEDDDDGFYYDYYTA